MEELKDAYFDVVVTKTGLPESVLAALLASSGKSVLHLDSNPFYGSDWATLSLGKLKNHFASCYLSQNGATKPRDTTTSTELQQMILQKEQFQQYNNINIVPVEEIRTFSDVQIVDLCSAVEDEWLKSTLIDLTPQIILASGQAVDMLVRTQASSHLEFRGVDQVLYLDSSGHTERVPTSRNDIFRSTLLTPSEKRLFMKFLKTCAVYEPSLFQYEGRDGGLLSAGQVVSSNEERGEKEQLQEWFASVQSLDDWLDKLGFTDRLKQYLFALLGCCGERYESCSVVHVVERISQYCCAVQRFRISSGFLYCKYGTGDICEALCRRCAVHGGVYILRRQVAYLICDSLQVIGLVTDYGDVIRCSGVVGCLHYFMPTCQIETTINNKGMWRLYMILDRPILLPGKGVDVFTTSRSVPVHDNIANEQSPSQQSTCWVQGIQIEQSIDSSHTAYVFYLFCDQVEHGKTILKKTLEQWTNPTLEENTSHYSIDLMSFLRQLPGLKYAMLLFHRDWEPSFSLGHHYCCSLTKDMHSMQSQLGKVYTCFENILGDLQT
ncbi:hypothetical protein GAYE_SCF13G3447 [Galdieria yellowstonensis]|uniref:Rab proteins geranylgeranyltransferase component A n=1 Tax=Galdieria yellowstonensis TaxID=3028027 RepID=A0AAV9IDY8_9RHOD|nr:hypothetical protein GAYE_SCF13G3447 [Galdieria yellowstonensis]